MVKAIRLTAILWALLFSGILGTSSVLAKGPPDKVTIEGPGLKAPIEVTDSKLLMAFSLFHFENIERLVPKPKDAGPGYTITRYIHDHLFLREPHSTVVLVQSYRRSTRQIPHHGQSYQEESLRSHLHQLLPYD